MNAHIKGIVFLSISFFFISLSLQSQCIGGSDTGTIVTPTSTFNTTGNFRGGQYFTMNITNGRLYTVSTMGLANWDTQLTVLTTTNNVIAYNDDFEGTRQSELSFLANFTGQVRVLLTQFNCQNTSGGTTARVRYKGTTGFLSVNNVSVEEEAGILNFTVTYSGTSTSAFTVNYATANVTAREPLDYTSVSGVLNFSGTSGQQLTVAVPIIDDPYGENTETFNLQLSNATNNIDIAGFGTGTITDTDPPIPNNSPLVLVDEFSGYFDYSTTGGSLRTADNNTNPCAIKTTSSNTLLSPITAGATISKAYLYWAHSSLNPDNEVTFEGQTVTADKIYGSLLINGPAYLQFYSYVSDVTSLIQGISNPSTNVYDFSGLTIDTGGDYCATATVMGGWSLMVFYEQASLPAVTINLYEGFKGETNSSTTFTLSGFFAIGASGSKTTVLSWEGDQTLSNNERLSVTSGLGNYTLSGDGDNNGETINNPFNSTIYDNTVLPNINTTNTHGLDLDTYNISSYIQPGENSVTTTVQAGQDYVMMNAVLLKVPSNLITGTVYEDVNYGGGDGRSLAVSNGAPIAGAVVELYDASNALLNTELTNESGRYRLGGMANGNYRVRVVNSSINSTRGGGTTCTTCLPVQTYRRDYTTNGGFINKPNEVGGSNPSGVDGSSGTLTNAQTVSTVTITSEGIVDLDFGFNFNTIVNTNENGQGSLDQFISNANNLDETGLDIVANSIFDPTAGEDTSIFMIPPIGDPQGRTPDAKFANGYFDIFISSGSALTTITADNTKIDGRTQSAYSTDTNVGTVGAGGAAIGTSGIALPNYELPEIQLHSNAGDVITVEGNNTVIRNLAIYANNNAGIVLSSGSILVTDNLIGVNAAGVYIDPIKYGIEIIGGTSTIDGNYIATNTDSGIWIQGGTSTLIQNNHIKANGDAACDDNITIISGSGIIIQHNLIENAAALGIDGNAITGNITITDNSITGSGQNGGNCSGIIENAGIRLDGNNSSISNNVIYANGGPGLVLAGGTTSGNLISQNSFYANGIAGNALGIDLDNSDAMGDGVTLNDNGDGDSGPNGAVNFPVISGAYVTGTSLIVEGWSRPGATIEIFLTDINQGSAVTGANQLGRTTDYGEGQLYLATFVEGSGADSVSGASSYIDLDGNTDTTNKFKFSVPLPSGVIKGSLITSTATVANSTSEFSPSSIITTYNVITNRRITYRIKTN